MTSNKQAVYCITKISIERNIVNNYNSDNGGYIVVGSFYDLSDTTINYVDALLIKLVTLEVGLARVSTRVDTLTLYRGADDAYWQHVRSRIWKTD